MGHTDSAQVCLNFELSDQSSELTGLIILERGVPTTTSGDPTRASVARRPPGSLKPLLVTGFSPLDLAHHALDRRRFATRELSEMEIATGALIGRSGLHSTSDFP